MEHLVTCSYDGTVAIWEMRSGQGFQPTQLSRWSAHGPASAALLPASPNKERHTTATKATDDAPKQPKDSADEVLENTCE